MSPTPQTHRTSDAHELCTIYNLSSICHELFHLYITNSTDTQTHRPAHECPAYDVSHQHVTNLIINMSQYVTIRHNLSQYVTIPHNTSQTPTTITNSRETHTDLHMLCHISNVTNSIIDISRTRTSNYHLL